MGVDVEFKPDAVIEMQKDFQHVRNWRLAIGADAPCRPAARSFNGSDWQCS
jgi:hypothetical protein